MSEQLKDLRKLCILNAKETETDDDIRNVCEEFGQLVGFNRPPNNKRLAFPLFKTPSDAAAAKDGLSKKGYHVDYAKAKPSPGIGGGDGDGGRVKREEFRSTHTLNGGGHNGSENGGDNGAHVINDNESMDNRPYGRCLKCGDRAYYNCARCSDFYCSEECQSSDWLVHKRNCFPMPKLVATKSQQNLMLGKSMEKLKLNDSPPAAAKMAAKSTDAADGHDVKPASVPAVQLRSPKQIDTEEVKPMVKVEPKPAKPASVNSIERVANEASNNSLSPRQKIVLSISGSAQSSTTAINRSTSETIQNEGEVWITHVRNYQTIYVRAVANDAAYLQMMKDVAAAAETAPCLKSYPFPKEDTVLAPFDGAYYRAMVLSCDENAGLVRVGYIDFGNSQEVPFSTLKVLPTELKERPRLTFIVKLKNLKDEPEAHELVVMKEYLEQISENGSSQVLKITGDRPYIEPNDTVELFDVISSRSINEHLNSLVQKRYHMFDLTQKVLKVDRANLPKLLAIDTTRVGDSVITCLVKDDVKMFMENDEKTQKYGDAVKNAPAYKPNKKELCVVRIKEQEGYFWYRCMYQTGDLVNEKAQVYCIDYGKVEKVRANNIRAMSSGLLHEITSIICDIKNGKSVSSENRWQFFDAHPEFTPLDIEYDAGDKCHLITVDFSGTEEANQ